MDTVAYSVPGMTCDHCRAAVAEEISAVPGVQHVTVDLASKSVEVQGRALDDRALRAAIENAGYDVA